MEDNIVNEINEQAKLDLFRDIRLDKLIELRNIHRDLVVRYCMKQRFELYLKKRLIKIYDDWITDEKLERHYNLKVQVFMDEMLSNKLD